METATDINTGYRQRFNDAWLRAYGTSFDTHYNTLRTLLASPLADYRDTTYRALSQFSRRITHMKQLIEKHEDN